MSYKILDERDIDLKYSSNSEKPQSGKAVAEAVDGAKEKWVKLISETLTENLATEFRAVFDKPYKKLRIKIMFKGDKSTTLSNVRFKRAKADGSNAPVANNYLKYSSGGNLSNFRLLWGTASFDVDGQIVINDGGSGTQYAVLSPNCTTIGGGDIYPDEEQNFPEFYFYLGGSIAADGTLSGNVIGNGTTIQVWGANNETI